MGTHDKIIEAIRALADFEPLSVCTHLRNHDIIFMDSEEIRAYKVGNCNPLKLEWEDLTPVEALMLKRACRYRLETLRQEAEGRLVSIMTLEEKFQKSPFGC